ncbi:peroxin [Myotisia sp. PD_48]|nr:peroxin [Myotisia sp. PD_48]
MITATKRWLRRHRNGIAIGAGVVGVGYFAGQYVLGKISEARERMGSERVARDNLRRRFEQNQTDCTFTVLALLPTAADNILAALPVEELTNELQQKRAERLAKLESNISEISSEPPSAIDEDGRSMSSFRSHSHAGQAEGEDRPRKKSRTQLWNELKVNSLTRSFTLLYTLSLLTLLTRIQLNLLGRKSYLSSVVSLAAPPSDSAMISMEDHDDGPDNAFGNDFETNRRYLTFSWWLLHRGWKDLMEKVEEAVVEVFGSLNPRETIRQEELSELTLEVRKRVEGATTEERRIKRWLPYLLPPRNQEDYVLRESGVLSSNEVSPQTAANLRRLLDETSDLVDSPQFTHILSLLNNEAFSYLIDNKCNVEAFKNTPPHAQTIQSPTSNPAQGFSSSATIIPISETPLNKVKLATILAVITRQAHIIGHGSTSPNEYLSAMEEGVSELEAFAAVVYSSNFCLDTQNELVEHAGSLESSYVAVKSTTSPQSSDPVEGWENLKSVSGEPSVIELKDSSVLGEGNFESAWGKAVDRS